MLAYSTCTPPLYCTPPLHLHLTSILTPKLSTSTHLSNCAPPLYCTPLPAPTSIIAPHLSIARTYLLTSNLSTCISPLYLHLTSLPEPHLSICTSPLYLHPTSLPEPHLSTWTSPLYLHPTSLLIPNLSTCSPPLYLHPRLCTPVSVKVWSSRSDTSDYERCLWT